MKTINKGDFLVMLLTHEITKVIDEELIKCIKDPNYKPELSPMECDDKTHKILLRNHKKQMKLYEEYKNGNVKCE